MARSNKDSASSDSGRGSHQPTQPVGKTADGKVDKSVASGGDDWGYQPGKGGMAIEAKLGMFIIMILLGAFGLLVYRNVDRHQMLLADSEELDPAGSPTEMLDQMTDRMRADEAEQPKDSQAMSFADLPGEVNDSFRGGAKETESLTAATDIGATEAVEDVFSSFEFDSEEPSLDSTAALEEPVAELFPQDSEDNQFPVAQEDDWQVAESTSGQTVEQPESTVNIPAVVLEEEEPELGVGQDVRFEFDTESPVSTTDSESLLVDTTDQGPATVVGNESFNSLPQVEIDSFDDTASESRLTIAMLDEESQADFQNGPDLTEPSIPLVLSSPDSALSEPEPIAADPVFGADEELVLKDAGSEESTQLRSVTPAVGQQSGSSGLTYDKFNLPEFAYENRVVTASAEDEPCEVCEVQPGDNYWKISRRAYGTTQYFSALALYNHNRVGDPKRLRPGMKVLLPDAELLEKKYPKLFPAASPRTRKPSGYFVQPDGTAAYRIGEKDTLSQIAQKHLGRSSRWIQIYRLNPNVLSNPNRLKPGTVIILPDSATDVHMVP